MRILSGLFVIAIAALTLMVLPGGSRVSPALASGEIAMSPGPLNADFEEQAYDTGSPPSNYDFASGTSGWTGSNFNVTSGYAVSTSNATMDSSLFNIPSDAQTIRWDESYLGGGANVYNLYLVDGSGDHLLYSNIFGAGSWRTIKRNISSFAGETNVKISIRSWGSQVAIDNVGIMRTEIPQWKVVGSVGTDVSRVTGGGPGGAFAAVTAGAIVSTAFPVQQDPFLLNYFRHIPGSDAMNVLLVNASDGSPDLLP